MRNALYDIVLLLENLDDNRRYGIAHLQLPKDEVFGIGSDQAKLPILDFIHSNTLGFLLQYLSFRHQKGHYRVAGSPEVQNLPYFSELDGQPQSYPFGF